MPRRSSRVSDGIACVCGCASLPVLYTRRARGYITRRRECEKCGLRYTTVERLVVRGGAQKSQAIGIAQLQNSIKLDPTSSRLVPPRAGE